MSGSDEHLVRGPQDLPSSIAPTRDLWPGIAAALAAGPARDAGPVPQGAGVGERDQGARVQSPPAPVPRRQARWAYGLGLAATVACLALGIWIGRASAPEPTPAPAFAGAAFAPDARFGRERQALLVQARLGLSRLSVEDRAKVEASLATIRDAIGDIRAALGEDPGNQLLQEMLVNSYQDEIRVLTAVTQAGAPGQEI